jgi:periplasmic protein TonB
MMHLSQTNTKDFDELVFTDRNQAYGAYVLRKKYSSTMLKSLLMCVAFTASLLAAPYLSNLMHHKKIVHHTKSKDSIVVHSFPPPDPQDPEPRRGNPPPPVDNTPTSIIPQITTENLDDTLTTSEDPVVSDPGISNVQGDPNEWGLPGDPGEGGTIIGEDENDKVIPFAGIAEPPVYPGGDEAMWEFLGDNLNYPEHARQIQLEGTVHVTFVVDQFGNVTKITVPREIGGGLDEEAKRVVSLMPRWTPGKQNGRPVKVGFHLPIIFKLN